MIILYDKLIITALVVARSECVTVMPSLPVQKKGLCCGLQQEKELSETSSHSDTARGVGGIWQDPMVFWRNFNFTLSYHTVLYCTALYCFASVLLCL